MIPDFIDFCLTPFCQEMISNSGTEIHTGNPIQNIAAERFTDEDNNHNQSSLMIAATLIPAAVIVMWIFFRAVEQDFRKNSS